MSVKAEREDIAEIVARVLEKLERRLERQPGGRGVYSSVADAVAAAERAQRKLEGLDFEKREQLISSMREAALANARPLSEMAVKETGLGRVEDKIMKNILAARKTPGTEDLCPRVFTGDHGLTLVEMAPYGVIASITPVTNPSETIICNAIGMIAAGNSVVFCPHPSARLTSVRTVELLHDAISRAGGPPDLVTILENPSIAVANELMRHPRVALVVATGGPGLVRAALTCGKKAIAAGAGNPPVVVDQTADVVKAARDILAGASFDNNLPCIAEKELVVVEEVADLLIQRLQREGAYLIQGRDVDALTKLAFTPVSAKDGEEHGCSDQVSHWLVNKELVGKDAWVILERIGIEVSRDTRLVIFEADASHPFAREEQLMPVLPIIRARGTEEAMELAVRLEKGNRHTAVMHSKHVDNLTALARAIKTTIFVKNAPSYAGIGAGGEGYCSFTIAGPTGEGLTSARSFARQRRCVLSEGFRII